MNRIVAASLIAVVATLGLFAPAQASKAPVMHSKINDNAGYFSDEAKEKARKVMAEIFSTNAVNVVVETFKTAPTEYADKVKSDDDKVRGQAFNDWAKSRAKESHSNIYVLICASPVQVQAMVGNETQAEFSSEERTKLASTINAKLKTDKDEALLAGLDYIKESLPAKAETAAAETKGGSAWGWIIWLIIIGLGVFLVIGLIRMMSGAGGFGGGGGGFGTSLLGGLFGAMAGMWIYNNFFGGHAHAADDSGGDTGGGDDMSSPNDTDYSGSGEDGGGDWGGGGDFGGGDF